MQCVSAGGSEDWQDTSEIGKVEWVVGGRTLLALPLASYVTLDE